MLDEVRDAGLRIGLVARAGADPEAERDRAHARDTLGDHSFARVQLGEDVLLDHARHYRGRRGWASAGTSSPVRRRSYSTQKGFDSGSRMTVHVRSESDFVSSTFAPSPVSRSSSRSRSSVRKSRWIGYDA